MRDLSVHLGTGRATLIRDWATVDGVPARREGLLRRLTTPRGALWYDRSYGNVAYARLSQPATTTWLQQIATDCRQAAEGEPGARVADVRVDRQNQQVMVSVDVIWDDAGAERIQAIL